MEIRYYQKFDHFIFMPFFKHFAPPRASYATARFSTILAKGWVYLTTGWKKRMVLRPLKSLS